MKSLSVFVDESGDFGPLDTKSPFYIVSLVFHNQEIDITNKIEQLNTASDNLKVDAKYGKYNGVDYTGCYVCGNCYSTLIKNYGYNLAAGY